MWWMLLIGCFGVYPFVNEPPLLERINGVEVRPRTEWEAQLPQYVPGEDYPITIEVSEPENQPVRVYFPASWGEVDFEPEARSGVWHVPEEIPPDLVLILNLRDSKDDDTEYQIWLTGEPGHDYLVYETGWPW